MSLKELVGELNRIEDEIDELKIQLKKLNAEKSFIWCKIMQHKTIREIYKTYMSDAKLNLYDVLEVNGYRRA